MVNYEPVSLSCARSESRPFGLRPAGPLALLLAPHVPHRVRIVARASPSGLGACSRMRTYFCANPKDTKKLEDGGQCNRITAASRSATVISMLLLFRDTFCPCQSSVADWNCPKLRDMEMTALRVFRVGLITHK